MIAVPVLDKAGEVIGVIVLHTQAPREFEDHTLNLLVHTVLLVAGAIENAQLYGETRRRVDALTTLTELSQSLASVTLREDLYDADPRGARRLLGADACQIWRVDSEAHELPPERPTPRTRPRPARARTGSRSCSTSYAATPATPRLRRRGSRRANACWWPPLAAGDERLGTSVASCAPVTSATRTRSCCALWPTRPPWD